MRIEGVTLPEKKHIVIGLTVVYGVGVSSSQKILKKAGVSPTIKVKDITDEQEHAIREMMADTLMEGDLRRTVSNNIKRLKEIKSYRGRRHSTSLPVRGQNTKTNARTRKGKRRTMGSGRVKLQKK